MKENVWINETLRQLESFGAVVESKSDLIWKVNDQLIRFVPAKSENGSVQSNTIILHEDLFHNRKNQLFMRLKSQLGLNENRIHGRSTRVVEITRKIFFINFFPFRSSPGGKMHPVGYITYVQLFREIAFPDGVKHFLRNFSVKPADSVYFLACVARECTHRKFFFFISRMLAAHVHKFVPADLQF